MSSPSEGEKYKKETLEEYAAGLDRLCDNDIDSAGLAVINWFTPETMAANAKSSKKDLSLPEHPFFN